MVANTESITSSLSLQPSGAFSGSSFPIYPTNFFWLGQIALGYSRFRFRRLRFWYLPSTGTSTNGRVAISQGFDYMDAAAPDLGSIIIGSGSSFGPVYGGGGTLDMRNPFAATGLIKTDFDVGRRNASFLPVITQAKFKALPLSDQNDYSPGYVEYGTDSGTVSSAMPVGGFYVTYEVELSDPIAGSVN